MVLAPLACAGPHGDNFKVLMIRRHAKARFMANTFVFPGGCVDETDASVAAIAAKVAGRALGPLAGQRVAALRELQEETGVTLAPDGAVVPLPCVQANPATPAAERGGDVSAVAANANDEAAARRLAAAAAHFTPYAHWVTPAQEKHRYDTWFFLHVAPPAATLPPLAGDPKEVSATAWVGPKEAISRHMAGMASEEAAFLSGGEAAVEAAGPPEFRLPPPTFLILDHLSKFGSAAELAAEYRRQFGASVAALPPIEPVLEFRASGSGAKELHMHMPAAGNHFPRGEHRVPVKPMIPGAGGTFNSTMHVGSPKAEATSAAWRTDADGNLLSSKL